jgi:hypothetical protein
LEQHENQVGAADVQQVGGLAGLRAGYGVMSTTLSSV